MAKTKEEIMPDENIQTKEPVTEQTTEAEDKEETVNVSKTEFEAILKRLSALEETKVTEEKTQTNVSQERKKANEALQKRVKVKLFKDGEKYKDDVFVSINGVAMQIKRGVEVEIPKAYADVIEQSMMQSVKTMELIEEEEGKSRIIE